VHELPGAEGWAMTSEDWKDLAEMVKQAWSETPDDSISASKLIVLLREKAESVSGQEDLAVNSKMADAQALCDAHVRGEAYARFHQEWGMAVGSPGYDKEAWKTKEIELFGKKGRP
jgi:hypothetical protein